ncbi:MAG: hypothetical protein PUD59_02760 [bacterium]|nr:hypothetical protein [bacterium]
MLNKAKDIIFYFIIFYTITFTILLINQSFSLKKELNKKMEFIKTEEYEQAYINAKKKINDYKLNAYSDQDKLCLTNAEKIIDKSNKNQSLGEISVKEFFEQYYNDVNNNLLFLQACKFDEEAKKKISVNMIASMILIERFTIEKKFLYEVNLTIKDFYSRSIFEPSIYSIEKNAQQTFELRLQNIDKNMILQIMESLGDKYE